MAGTLLLLLLTNEQQPRRACITSSAACRARDNSASARPFLRFEKCSARLRATSRPAQTASNCKLAASTHSEAALVKSLHSSVAYFCRAVVKIQLRTHY